jgi:SAM-dependent methyltransferase
MITELAKSALRTLPPTRQIYDQRRKRTSRPDELDPASVEAIFKQHSQGQVHGRVLEIGPGGNLGVCQLFLDAGAEEVVAIDVDPWAGESESLRISYLTPANIETLGFPNNWFQIIYSNACFEHVNNPGKAIRNIARMLAPGGVTTHQIDLRDHRNFDRPLEFLRYSNLEWALRTSHALGRTNRWRASDYREAFTQAGLEVDIVANMETEVDEEQRLSFAPRFRDKPDLGVLGIMLTATKSTHV